MGAGRGIPARHSLTDEVSVLGSLICDPAAIGSVSFLDPLDFHDDRCMEVYAAILTVHGRGDPVDPVTLERELDRQGKIRAVGGLTFLSELGNGQFIASNVVHYATVVHALAEERRIRIRALEVATSTDEGEGFVATARAAAATLVQTQSPSNGHVFGKRPSDFLSLDDDADDDDSASWIVRGIIPAAAPVVFGGKPKSRKSYMALHLMLCIASGKARWLEQFPIRQGKVLIMAHEDPTIETRSRIWRLARGLGLNPRTDLEDTLRVMDRSERFRFDDERRMAELYQSIKVWRPDVIMMDSLSRMVGGDEGKGDMEPATTAWLDLAAEWGVTVLSIHHLVKMLEGRTLIDSLRGTGDVGATARWVVGFAKDGEDRNLPTNVRTEGTFTYQPPPFSVRMREELSVTGKVSYVLEYDGPLVRQSGATQRIHDQVLDHLQGGPMTTGQLCNGPQRVRGKTEVIVSVLGDMQAKGEIRRLGVDGPWMRPAVPA